jgi:putative spermidine/putrescine transport system ATP-binding protein
VAYLELSNVYKSFGAGIAVEDFNLEAERGEFVSFLGPSGCGKTTTLRMIAGFETPTSGSIKVEGADITRVPPNARRIGMVFQSYALFPNMTVAQNIAFGLKVARKPASETKARVDEMLQLIGLPKLGGRYPSQLSGGQQQRVALARALAIKPRLLLLDEPLSALDAKIRVSLRNEIKQIQRQLGITAIYVTHDQEEALSLSDRIVVMSAGRIEQTGTPFDIYNYPKTSFVASFVGTLNRLTARVADAALGKLEVEGQEISVATPLDGFKVGDSVEIALRPESISMNGAHPSDGANHIEATLEDIAFLGSVVRMRVRLGDSALLFDTFSSPHLALPSPGQVVPVSFSRQAVFVFENSGARQESPTVVNANA